MALTIGGADIAEASITFSWGLAPGSASLTVPGELALGSNEAVSIDLGGVVFHGMTTSSAVVSADGKSTRIQAVDNRIKLMWDSVYASFNGVEVRADDPLTPGIDRQKRYVHILPDDYPLQKKTWTDVPYTAAQIIAYLIGAPTVAQTWAVTTHAAQAKAVLGLDFQGVKLGNALQEVTERQGLVFTISGANTLQWARKGDGTLPSVPAGSTDIRLGDALSHNDTEITLLGDRNQYQDMPITLEPAWNALLEPFWSAPAWWAEVKARFSLSDGTPAQAAALSAKAQSVTLREYVAVRDGTYADYGLWGEVGRMEIPVWLYLRDIVFKCYQIPRTYTLRTIPLFSLVLHEGLLAAVTYGIDSGAFALKSPREYYPDTKAFVIVQGTDLSLLDPRTQSVITETQLSNMRDKWTATNKFSLDGRNMTLLFQEAIFKAGADAAGLFLFPNAGKDGIDDDHKLRYMAVPNAGVTVAAAPVKAVLVFEAELYSKTFGSGVRRGARVVKDLNLHWLLNAGSFTEEVKYVDDKTADEKATAEAAGLILAESTYAEGGFTRHGACGTGLTGVIDRTTISVNFSDGLTEVVEYTKERSQSNFEHARELDRRAKVKDLFPGQATNAAEVENLKILAQVTKELPRRAPSAYSSLAAVLQRPFGSPAGVQMLKLAADKPAGAPIFDADGVFQGVVVAENSVAGAQVAVAKGGELLVRVQGPFVAGDSIGWTSGDEAVVGGAHFIGQANALYEGADVVLTPVLAGGGAAAPRRFFQIYDASTRDGAGHITAAEIKLVSSLLCGDVPTTGISAGLSVSSGQVIYGRVAFSTTTGAISSRTFVAGASLPDNEDGVSYIRIGSVTITDDSLLPVNDCFGPVNACRVAFVDPLSYTLEGSP